MSILSRAIAEHHADRVLSDCGIAGIPVDPIAIAQSRGIEVQPKPDTAIGVSGLLVRVDQSYGIMYATHIPSKGFQRFSIAHELGHYFLPGHIDAIFANGDVHQSHAGFVSQDPYEVEADSFAAALLMPPKLFMKQFRHAGGDPTTQVLAKVADDFRVSKHAAARRLIDFRKDCAAILSRQGVIEYVYRGDDFPFITLKSGQPVPRDSITKKQQGEPGTHSEIEETEPATWTSKQPKRGLLFLEQVLIQSNGHRLSLLTLDESECEDEEDEQVRESSEWNPTFHRSRRK